MRAERLFDLSTAAQVRRQRGVVLGDQPTQVDDLFDAARGRRAPDVVGADQVEILERALDEPRRRQHRVHEVRDVARPGERGLDILEREQIAGDEPVPRPARAAATARQPGDIQPFREPLGHRMADKAGRAGDHDRIHVSQMRVVDASYSPRRGSARARIRIASPSSASEYCANASRMNGRGL